MPSGIFLTGAENLTPSGIRSSDRPAHSGSPYRLSYPGCLRGKINPKINNARYDDACTLSALTTGGIRGACWKGLRVHGDCRACLKLCRREGDTQGQNVDLSVVQPTV